MRNMLRRLARLRRRRSGRHTHEEGQALVEFALVAPILILLVVGVFEFARAWQAYQSLTDAAREVARNAVVETHVCDFTPTPAFCPADVNDVPAVLSSIAGRRLSESGLDPAGMVLTITPADPSAALQGAPVTVNLKYTYTFVFVGALLAWTAGERGIELKTEFVMRKE